MCYGPAFSLLSLTSIWRFGVGGLTFTLLSHKQRVRIVSYGYVERVFKHPKLQLTSRQQQRAVYSSKRPFIQTVSPKPFHPTLRLPCHIYLRCALYCLVSGSYLTTPFRSVLFCLFSIRFLSFW